MRLKIAVCAMFVMSASAPLLAAQDKYPNWPWVHAGRYQPATGDGITIWVNMESLKRAGPHRLRVWIKYENDRPNQDGVKEALSFEQLECDRDWHTNYSLVNYGANGRVISSSKGTDADAEPIVPDSLLAGIMPFTCAAGGMQH